MPVQVDNASSRINALLDINAVLADALDSTSDDVEKTRQSLRISIRASQAVSADLEAVCDEQLLEKKERMR